MSLLTQGHGTKIYFTTTPILWFEEKSITPPAIDGGEPINTTVDVAGTQRVSLSAPRAKVKMGTNINLTVAYDPRVYNFYSELNRAIGLNQYIRCQFPDNSQLRFLGWIQSFSASAMQEGEQPEASVSITISNFNLDTNSPEAPVFSSSTVSSGYLFDLRN